MKNKSEQTMKQKLMTIEKMRRCYAELLLVPSVDEENYPYDDAPAARVTFLMDKFNCLQSHATLLDNFIRNKEKFGLSIVGQVDLSKYPSDNLDDLDPASKWLIKLIFTSSKALEEDRTKRERRFYDDVIELAKGEKTSIDNTFLEPLVTMIEGRKRIESGEIKLEVTPLLAFQVAHYGFGKERTRGEKEEHAVRVRNEQKPPVVLRKTKSIKNISR